MKTPTPAIHQTLTPAPNETLAAPQAEAMTLNDDFVEELDPKITVVIQLARYLHCHPIDLNEPPLTARLTVLSRSSDEHVVPEIDAISIFGHWDRDRALRSASSTQRSAGVSESNYLLLGVPPASLEWQNTEPIAAATQGITTQPIVLTGYGAAYWLIYRLQNSLDSAVERHKDLAWRVMHDLIRQYHEIRSLQLLPYPQIVATWPSDPGQYIADPEILLRQCLA